MSPLKKTAIALLILIVILVGVGWYLSRGNAAQYSLEETAGTDPVLAAPESELVPTIGINEPVGWGDGEAPQAAEGLTVNRFASGLDHPRVLYTLPNGDVLVTLTGAPDRELAGGWLANKIGKWLMSRAGAGEGSPNQLLLLRDEDGDGVAETQIVLRDDLSSPSGIAWGDGALYIANHDAVLKFDYALGEDAIAGEGKVIAELPAGGNHWMRNLLLSEDGTKLYVAVGSASNIAEDGMAAEKGRAAIHEINLADGYPRLFGSGLRNPNGMAWNPWTGEIWTVVNERDMLGSDLVPDYLTNVPIGVHYGWPWVYYNDVIDERVKAPMPEFLTEYTRTPQFALGAHTAPLGLVFTETGTRLGGFGNGAFVARHGSWNRKPASGYDVVFIPFDDRGNPKGKPMPVLQPFLTGEGTTHGRPTWLAWDKTGGLLVSDDMAGIIWRVIDGRTEPAKEIKRNEGAPLKPKKQLKGDPRRAFDEVPEGFSPGEVLGGMSAN